MDLSKYKILVVGAGGIGCELLKNLALSGCKNITVIDLDTIEYSNLNRQFLFRREHVGKPKAQIAAEAVKSFAPSVSLLWHHKNITEPEFDVNFFRQFDFVLNALDNSAARNHVNRLCLAADVYLIESGSAGYLGQTTVIKKGVTECYECQPKAPQKSYPACTIRNTPSEPIHCIVWAKHLFNQLFGEADPDEEVTPDVNDAEIANGSVDDSSAKNGEQDKNDSSVENASTTTSHNSLPMRLTARKWAEDSGYDPELIFSKLYQHDIAYLLSMTNLWKKRVPPVPLNFDNLCPNGNANSSSDTQEIEDQKVWTPCQCRSVFIDSVRELKGRRTASNDAPLVWDKDDELCMNFVTAAANLRCLCFHIPLKSRFETKSMAGNIIPAIATTNAIVAGLMTMELYNLSARKFQDCATTYLLRKPNYRGNYFTKCELVRPNPKCYVCSEKSEVCVKVNVEQFTLKSLEEKVLKQTLNMIAPDVEIDDNKGTIIISSEQGEICGLYEKTLKELNIGDGSRLNCDDFKQQFELRLIIVNCIVLKNDEFIVETDTSSLQPVEEKASSSKNDIEADIIEIDEQHAKIELKRKHLPDGEIVIEDGEALSKRLKVTS